MQGELGERLRTQNDSQKRNMSLTFRAGMSKSKKCSSLERLPTGFEDGVKL
jgi:hypothetical protein